MILYLPAVVSLEGWSIKFEDIRGAVPIPYDGVPFIQLGSETRECQYGPDRNRNRKKKDMILQVLKLRKLNISKCLTNLQECI